MRFRQIEGKIAFVSNNKVIYTAQDIGLIMDRHLGSIKAHGPSAVIEKLFNQMENSMALSGLPDFVLDKMARDIVYVAGSFNPQELDSLFSVDGAVEEIYQREVEKAAEKSKTLLASLSAKSTPN